MLGATLGVKDYLDRVCREIQELDPAQPGGDGDVPP